MPTQWMISIAALWILVLFETVLLILLLRALGEIKQQGSSSSVQQTLKVGDIAPTFATTTHYGEAVDFEEYQGKRRILVFISPGCPACEGTIKALNQFVADPDPSAPVVLLVGGPTPRRNKSYAASHQTSIPILTGTIEITSDLYHIHANPFVFVIDEEGIIRARGVVNRLEDLKDLIDQAFSSEEVSHDIVG